MGGDARAELVDRRGLEDDWPLRAAMPSLNSAIPRSAISTLLSPEDVTGVEPLRPASFSPALSTNVLIWPLSNEMYP